ncbi:MAG: hypothetical protein DRN88_01610 [Candidatus Hydrothermarchaeota archaeon]|nr:MAG: hypothetical protein DRN88_01610 [Candidatus Hydrothermarchaeota archaeon]
MDISLSMISRLSKKGQVVIPKEIREKLNIKTGDVLIFRVEGDKIFIETIREKLKDILKAGKPVEPSVEFQRKLREE